MSTERTVSIYAPANGRKNYVAHDVPVRKLANYSQYAEYRYFPVPDAKKPYGEGGKRSTSTREYDLGPNMNEEFARTIAIHVKNSDPTNPAPITLELFGEDRSFEELVQIYRVMGWGFKCERKRHDESIRKDLRAKMYAITPFTFDHFLLIAEKVEFDRGLVHSAMDKAVILHIEDKLDDDVKMAIENYCKARGEWWEQLLETVGRVQVKHEKEAAREEARQKRREEQEAKAERNVREEGKKKGPRRDGRGKNGKKGSGKDNAKKPVKPFVRKEGDFPPLS